ncbi:MAG: cation diffusion facilitator family transporter [Candidatus Bathyarchaeota archaeon]
MSKRKAALTAVFGGLFIFALKLVAWALSGSVALLSDALESIVNLLASGMMLFSVIFSGKPADETHPYGHEKVENLSMLVEGGLIVTAGLFIVHEAWGRIFQPVQITEIETALVISLAATSLNGVISWHLTRTSEETDSPALKGDAIHLLSDVVSSFGVVVGLYLANLTGWDLMDPVLALLVSGLVFKMGVGLVYGAAQNLMDRSAPEEEAKIREVLTLHESRFVDFHEIKTRRSGGRVYAELHLSVEGDLTVEEAHDFTDHLEEELKKELPEMTVTIHIEPPGARRHSP